MTNNIITRFAPSPTGYLHVGNTRTALINWLFAKKNSGKFILRIDDTDTTRSTKIFKDQIIKDLAWLGIDYDLMFHQSERLDLYQQAKEKLLANGRLYACYETPQELEVKRKIQLSRGLPPIYDRAALRLSQQQIAEYQAAGRKPHYRFLIKEQPIIWEDLVKGKIQYQGEALSDPIIIRADGSMTYMLCSTIDDIDYQISHVCRGEDHVSNTAIQIQMFEALNHQAPQFGHLALIKAKEDKISKRQGGFDLMSLRQNSIEPMAINSFFTFIGSSQPIIPCMKIEQLIEHFDISTYSRSPTTYVPEELSEINHKLVINLEFADIQHALEQYDLQNIDEQFWLAVRPNLNKLSELKTWWEICNNPTPIITDQEVLTAAAELLPQDITEQTWPSWTKEIAQNTGKKGKAIFMPLRLALTGLESGPELKNLLPLLSRTEILARLQRR